MNINMIDKTINNYTTTENSNLKYESQNSSYLYEENKNIYDTSVVLEISEDAAALNSLPKEETFGVDETFTEDNKAYNQIKSTMAVGSFDFSVGTTITNNTKNIILKSEGNNISFGNIEIYNENKTKNINYVKDLYFTNKVSKLVNDSYKNSLYKNKNVISSNTYLGKNLTFRPLVSFNNKSPVEIHRTIEYDFHKQLIDDLFYEKKLK